MLLEISRPKCRCRVWRRPKRIHCRILLKFLMMQRVSVIGMKGTGSGTRAIRCMNQGTASSWTKRSAVQRMEGLIIPIRNGSDNPRIAIFPGMMR
ncbi:hypothetical protein AAC387_Pa03g2322 [Persea americana]